MKRLTNLQLNNNRTIATFSAIIVFFMDNSVYAQQAALGNAKKALEALQKDLVDNIIPIAAAVILLCLAIGYAGRYIEKDTFVRWAIGVVIAGSATQLVSMLFKPA
ncbi:VirB2 family type IV secretion system major pilin TrwL [Bartonella taylorii]|uniref:VirB2 family type IV secretion system major pilin TrwL n=1 Tax=Bartonella taylorii TaxID=33046 RepID=A0A9Q8YWS6_BARTA|nr:VirB2 family type IV secretion system major pilin TrwL [Bartonella taylorii]USP02374.1 VirB2 family type IV secretion system major pilin TrwL [Bartonella taylorii]